MYVFSKMKPLSPDGGAAATIAAWRGRGVVGGIGSRGRAGGMPFTLRAAHKESESVNGEKERVLEEMQQTLQASIHLSSCSAAVFDTDSGHSSRKRKGCWLRR